MSVIYTCSYYIINSVASFFNFPLTSTRIFSRFIVFTVIFTVTKWCVRSSVWLFFPTIFILSYEHWLSLVVFFLCLISVFVSKDNEVWVELSVHVFFFRIVPEEGINHLVHIGCSWQKFRHNVRQCFHDKHSSRHQMHFIYIKHIHINSYT